MKWGEKDEDEEGGPKTRGGDERTWLGGSLGKHRVKTMLGEGE